MLKAFPVCVTELLAGYYRRKIRSRKGTGENWKRITIKRVRRRVPKEQRG